MSDMKRYLPGSNQDSNQHGNQYSNQGNIMDQNSDQSSKTNKRSETRREIVETDDRAREAERDTIFGRVEKATGENDGTGLQMVKKHRAAVALLLALLMTISLAVPSSSEAISNNSRFSMIGTNVHQSAQKPTGDSKDNDRDAAARFLMGTTLLTQGLLSGNTSWSTAILSDTGFLQRMLEILNLLITDGVIEPAPDLSDSSEDDRDPHTPSRDSEDEPDLVPEDEEPEDPENPDEDENLDDPGETDGPEEPEGSVDPVDPDPDDPEDPSDHENPEEPHVPADPEPVDPDPGEPGQEPAPIFHTLTLHIDGQGTVTNNVYMEITGGSKEVASGTEVTFLAVPGEGYEFLYWRFTDEPDNALSSNQAYSIEGMTESVSITAHFKAQPEKFTVTLQSTEGGSAAFNPPHSSGEFEAGDSVTMVATPDDLYEFSHWSPTHDSEIILSNDVEYGIENIQKNMDVTAHFRILVIEKFVVTITSSEGGSAGLHADHSSSEFEEGEPVTVVAEPDDHFVFSHWSLAGDSDNELNTNKIYSFDMPENDVDLTAHFALIHKFEGGNGTEDEPYEIKTATQLAELLGNKPMLPEVYAAFSMETDLMQAHYKLVDDIDLSTHTPDDSWGPIGGSGASPASDEVFYGSFDGNGKTIKKLTINQPDESYQAMFHTIGSGAVVKNLTLLDPTITAKSHAAALAVNNHGIIERVEVKSTELSAYMLDENTPVGKAAVVRIGKTAASSAGNHGAGLVVYNFANSIIRKCGVEAMLLVESPGEVSFFGLLAAENMGTIEQSYAIGSMVRSKSGNLRLQISHNGGLVGINRNGGTNNFNAVIKDSYAIVTFKASSTIQGGIVGTLHKSVNTNSSDAVHRVYAVSDVTENSNTSFGSLVGNSNRTVVESYYQKKELVDFTNITGNGASADEMKVKETFVNWNFETIWAIDTDKVINNGYPYLRWQK